METNQAGSKSSRSSIVRYLLPFIVINSLMYAVAKDSLSYSQPFIFMSLRFAIASGAFYLIFRKTITLPNLDMALVGIFSASSGAGWLLGLNYVSFADSAVLSYTMPFFAMPLSYIFLKEKIGLTNVLGALLGIFGVLVYSETLPPGGSTQLGIALTLTNAFFYALFTVYYRKLRTLDVGNVLFWQCFLSFLFFSPLSLYNPRFDWTPNLLFDIIFVSVFGGIIMFYAWNMMTRSENVGRLATLVYLVPVMAIFYEFILYMQPPGMLSLVGAVIMLLGVYISRSYTGIE